MSSLQYTLAIDDHIYDVTIIDNMLIYQSTEDDTKKILALPLLRYVQCNVVGTSIHTWTVGRTIFAVVTMPLASTLTTVPVDGDERHRTSVIYKRELSFRDIMILLANSVINNERYTVYLDI